MELTITKINRTQRTSAKTNKPFTSVGIQTVEHGSKWLSGFGNALNASWKEGDKIDVIVEEGKPDKNGDPYLNFSMPKPVAQSGMSEEQFERLSAGKTIILSEIREIRKILSTPVDGLPPMPTDF